MRTDSSDQPLEPWLVEGSIDHIKLIKREMFGRTGLPLLRDASS